MTRRILCIFLLVSVSLFAVAQPFKEEIAVFKRQDSVSFPPKDAILFVGSSSFTKWKDMQDYFPGHTVINRGFGGSTLKDLYYYSVDVIFPYDPKQIVIYCGENDFAANDSLKPEEVAKRFVALYQLIRSKNKTVPVLYVSMKPSPARQHLMPKYVLCNALIKKFLDRERRTDYIDVYHAMLNKDGTPMTDIFVEDNLHMNKKGYEIWQKIIEPYLK